MHSYASSSVLYNAKMTSDVKIVDGVDISVDNAVDKAVDVDVDVEEADGSRVCAIENDSKRSFFDFFWVAVFCSE